MMRRKLRAAILALMVTGLVVAASFNYRGLTTAAPRASSASELLNMLPASDAIAFVDGQRMLSEIIPHIFANDAQSLADINRELDRLRDYTGTDARQLESVAVAVRFKNGTSDPQFIMGVVRGRFSATEAITSGLAKAAKNERPVRWKEEPYEGSTIYAIQNAGGFCLAAIDLNTIAFGDMEGIKAMMDARAGRGPRVDSSLVELASLNASAVAGFAANVPPSAVKKFAGGEDFGDAFNSIRQIYGSVDATGTTGAVLVALRSETGEKAQAMAEKLSSLKQLAGFYFSQSGAQSGALSAEPDAANGVQVTENALPLFSKWIKDATITAEGNDVKVRLEEPLTDIASLFRSH